MTKKAKRKVKTLEHVLKRKSPTRKAAKRKTRRKRVTSRRRKPVQRKAERRKVADPVYSRITNSRDFHIKILQVRKDTLSFFQKHQEVIRIREEKTLEEKDLAKMNLELIGEIKNLRKCLPHVREKNLPIKTEEVLLEEEEDEILEATQKAQQNKHQIDDLQKELKSIEHKINTI